MNSQVSSLAYQVGKQLSAAKLRVTCAESCTGGSLGAAVTSVAGSSAWFDAAFVTYSDAMKTALLGVPAELIASHGAVSEAVAESMLHGAIFRSGADLGVAITGIAGPSGGSDIKPVGTVCIAVGGLDNMIDLNTFLFSGDRQSIRDQAVSKALQLILTASEGRSS